MKCLNAWNLDGMMIPCNKCIACRKRLTSQWVFRLKQETKDHLDNPLFLTYTYAETPLTNTGKETLLSSDIINFKKRLRKEQHKLTDDRIKYFTVGEYGGIFGRPHFHSIIYGLDPEFTNAKWINGQWRYTKLENIWNNGFIHVAEAKPEAMAYVAGYCMDKLTLRQRKHDDDRQVERNYVSNGLGKAWLTEDVVKHYRKECQPYIQLDNGYKLSMPRYYREKLFNTPELRARYLDQLEQYSKQQRKFNLKKQSKEVNKSRVRQLYNKLINKSKSTQNLKEYYGL